MKSFLKAIIPSVAGVSLIFIIFVLFKESHPVTTIITNLFSPPESHNLKTVHSNQWYSSIYQSFPSQPLYAFPLAFRLTENGLGFSYPDVNPTPDAIHAPYVEDFTIGHAAPFTKQSLTSISDWSIQVLLSDRFNRTMQFTLGHGLPFTTIKSTENLKLSIPQPYEVYPDNQNEPFDGSFMPSQSFVLTTRNHSYLVVSPPGTTIERHGQMITVANKSVSIALLDNRDHYQHFLDNAFTEITGTKVSTLLRDGNLYTTYTIKTNQNTPPLVTLFPHQKDFLSTNSTPIGQYNSLRGALTLVKTHSFTTQLPLQIPATTFPQLTDPPASFKQQLISDTEQILSKPVPESRNYYLGTYLGKVASLIQLAESHGLVQEAKQLREHLKPVLSESLNHFVYDTAKTSLIAQKSEFGNDKLNDHHFHYGYYIRTAAILGQEDSDFMAEIKPGITRMVEDIASLDRKNPYYPFLRNFDMYEGHSWASGYAEFADGNNQESSSEALNAWYGLFLWAEITGDSKLSDYALYLFNTELTSATYYWFNIKGIYHPPYKHRIASIVWGGKVDFTTWFSQETNMTYGIQLLPFTPASFYLRNITPFSVYEKDFLDNNGNYLSPWGDLMAMMNSFSNPGAYQQYGDRTTNWQENNFPSLYSYFLLYNTQRK